MGRGGGRGRNRNKRGARRDQSAPMTRKDIVHIRQFGEKHPSQDLGREFGPSSIKRGKFDGNRGNNYRGGGSSSYRGRGRADTSHFGNRHGTPLPQGETSSESSEEEEATPYNELLSVFTGKKGDALVQILSSDEEEKEEEDAVDSHSNEGEKDDSGSSSDDNDEEEDDESDVDKGPSINQLRQGSLASKENLMSKEIKNSDGEEEAIKELDSDSGDELKAGNSGRTNANEDHDGAGDLDEDIVIEDAEIDPEINEMDDSKDCDGLDPFVQHFEREINERLRKCLKEEKPPIKAHTFDWPVIERVTYLGLNLQNEDDITVPQKTINLSELDNLPPAKIPDPPLTPLKNPTLNSLHIKSQLYDTLPLANQASIDKECCSQGLTPLQTELFDMASRYHDVYFPKRTISNAEEIRMVYCLHAANHALKTRSRILHHNARMANKSEVPESYRDQGFVRPKVLILVPFKDSALRIVRTIISLILKEEKGNVANKKRFAEDYGGQTLFMPKTNPKPEDYCATFNGNVEDNFKLGMSITKKSIKLYTGFYSSDIIVASPLGLRMIIGAEGEKNRDYDFLSSIEILIMDQADVFIMQNWDHVLHLIRHLNLQPVTTHGTDFARIRPWALDGLSRHYCQTMIFSSVSCPEHSSLLSRYCKNYAGQVRIIPTNLRGTICQVTVQLPQVFQNFDVSSIHDVDEKRFEYFTKHVLPNFKGKLMSHTLIFVSSYFDFVKIRNSFKRDEVSFVQICEYTKDKKIARARDLFFHGANHFMLYTERAHFFRRHRLKGIGHIIFYQLPQNPQFYPELCNFIQENSQNRKVRQRQNSSVNVIYCKYDAPRLAPIVGTERSSYMLNSDKKVHAFVSGEL